MQRFIRKVNKTQRITTNIQKIALYISIISFNEKNKRLILRQNNIN